MMGDCTLLAYVYCVNIPEDSRYPVINSPQKYRLNRARKTCTVWLYRATFFSYFTLFLNLIKMVFLENSKLVEYRNSWG